MHGNNKVVRSPQKEKNCRNEYYPWAFFSLLLTVHDRLNSHLFRFLFLYFYIIYFDHIIFSPKSSQILCTYLCFFSFLSIPSSLKKKKKKENKLPKDKTCKTKNHMCMHRHTKQNMESDWCWWATAEHEACPGVSLLYLVSPRWRTLIFSLPACVSRRSHLPFSVLEFCLSEICTGLVHVLFRWEDPFLKH